MANGQGYKTLSQGAIDPVTWAACSIDYNHKEIHNGDHYFLADVLTGVASGANTDFRLVTPNTTKWAHMLFTITASAGATITIYEAATLSGGTAATARNNNRNSSNTSGLTITSGPTVTATGTKLGAFVAGGIREAGMISRDFEIILKQNTTYLFRITSLGNSNTISYAAEWYEHTNKE